MKKLIIVLITLAVTNCTPSKKKGIASHFYTSDNTKIAFTDEGQGPAVLLIHGFIVHGSSWHKTVLKQQLLDAGYRVLIPDLRGNGNSDIPSDKEAYKNDIEVQDLIQLADHLQLERYTAIGYSRGSIILAKLLTKEKRITKAIFGGMGLDFTNPDWDRRIAFADAFSGRVAPNDMTQGAIDFAKSTKANIRALGFLQDYQPLTTVAELQNIHIKTLVLCGDQDRDNGSPEELKNQMPNSNLILVEGDHNNTYKQTNFAEAALRFLGS